MTPHDDDPVIPDAYGHPLFDPATDRRTGYRTRNILCVPLRDTVGKVVAIAQVLNKQGADAFDAEDERELAEFAESMSVIVDVSCPTQMRAWPPGASHRLSTQAWAVSSQNRFTESASSSSTSRREASTSGRSTRSTC